MEILNLFGDSSLLNLTILTDSDPQLRFSRLITDLEIEPNGVYILNTNLVCYTFMIIKVETSEGIHTKYFPCHSRSFVKTAPDL